MRSLLSLLLIATALSAPASVLRQPAQELVEQLTRASGREAAQELAEFGGREGVEELLERAVREGGDELVEQVTRLGRMHGAQALRAMRHSPKVITRALHELPPSMVRPAAWAIEREPELLTRLVARHGAKVLKAEVRHPGVGAKLVSAFADDGFKAANRLSTDQAIALTRHADAIGALPSAARRDLFTKLGQAPGVVLKQLNDNPKVLFTVAGVMSIAIVADEALQPSVQRTTLPDGTVIEQETSAFDTLNATLAPASVRSLQWLGLAIAAGVAGWFGIRIWGQWRKIA